MQGARTTKNRMEKTYLPVRVVVFLAKNAHVQRQIAIKSERGSEGARDDGRGAVR
jgi:hypothetical protein